ncbi:MAG: tripartite tricarboxylate transporter substrate binding protein [Pikeienuella sp.]
MKLKKMMALGVAALAATATTAGAEDWPTQPVHIIVPYAAGGGTDTTIRTLAPKAAEALGQTIVVENKPGGATIPATETVFRAKPDGYTIGAAAAPFTLNAALGKPTPYDPVNDFEHVIKLVDLPTCVLVNPAHPAQDFNEFIEWARAQEEPVLYATAGVGSMPHLWGAAMARDLGFKVEHVGYKGSAPALLDVMAGNIQVMLDGYTPGCQKGSTGEVRVLASAWDERLEVMADVPTIQELGYDIPRASANFSLFAPKDTPKEVVEKINAAFQAALDDPETKAKLAQNGLLPAGGPPEAFREFVVQQIDYWTQVVKDANISAN